MPTAHYSHKILIVGDDEPMFTALKDNLSAAGFENLLGARDGEEGLRISMALITRKCRKEYLRAQNIFRNQTAFSRVLRSVQKLRTIILYKYAYR